MGQVGRDHRGSGTAFLLKKGHSRAHGTELHPTRPCAIDHNPQGPAIQPVLKFWLFLLVLHTRTFQNFILVVFMFALIWVTSESFRRVICFAPSQCSFMKLMKERCTGSAGGMGMLPLEEAPLFIPLTGAGTCGVFQKSLAFFHPHTFHKAEYRCSSEQPNMVKDAPAHWRRAGTGWIFKVSSNPNHSMILSLLCWL